MAGPDARPDAAVSQVPAYRGPVRRAPFLAVVACLAFGIVAAACGGDDVETGTVNGVAGGKPTADAREVKVEASNFQFDPDRITIDAQEEIALDLKSDDNPHDFAVEGLGLIADVGAGDDSVQRLRIDQPGEYTFFCTLPGHRDGGMEGTLVVR
jgi:plastocyanin